MHDRTDEVMGRKMGEGMTQRGPLLLGRRTYEDFFSFWPNQTETRTPGAGSGADV